MSSPFFVGLANWADPANPPLLSVIQVADGFVWDFTAAAFVAGDAASDPLRPFVSVLGTAHRGIGVFLDLTIPDLPTDGALAVLLHDPSAPDHPPIGDPIPVRRPRPGSAAIAVSLSMGR